MQKDIQHIDVQPLAIEISALIDQGKSAVKQVVNSTITHQE